MARVTPFTRTVLLDRANVGNISASAAANGGNAARGALQDAARFDRNAQQAGALLNQEMQQKAAEKQVNAQKKFNEIQRERIQKQQEDQLARQGNPSGFAKEFDDWHVNKTTEFEESLGDNDGDLDLDYFRELMERDRNQVFASNTDWETGQRVRNTYTGTEQNIEGMNTNFMLSNPSYKDFVDYQAKMRDYVTEVGSNILSPQDQIKLYEFGVDNAAKAFFDQQLTNNPRGLKRVLDYGKGGQDALIDFVMNDIEGGGRYVKDGDGYAKYGINSAANPDVDVKNLTPDAAIDTYKKRYWDKRLDEMAPAFQAVAFDALVNHGNDKDTWAMIQQANGNPTALLSIRQKEYARLVQQNPAKYGKNAAGWDNRLKKLGAFVNDMEGGGAAFLQNASLVDPVILHSVRERIPQAIKDEDTAIAFDAKKAREADIVTQIGNEDTMLVDVIYNEQVPIKDRISTIRQSVLSGDVRSEFGSQSIAYLNSLTASPKNVPPEQKFATFSNLSDELKQIRIDLGGTSDAAPEEIVVDENTLGKFQTFQANVMTALAAGEITSAEAKMFTGDFSDSIMTAIEGNETDGGLSSIGRLAPGVQDPYGYAFTAIDKALENNGQSKNLALKKAMVMRFYEISKNYESSLNTAKDEQILNGMLKQTYQSLNQKNYAGIIPADKNPAAYVQAIPDVQPQHVFEDEAQARGAKLADGTPISIGGNIGYWRND